MELKPCINFNGHINNNGYGVVLIKNKLHLAHRISFRLANPNRHMRNNFCVCHKCDNKICINPDHLFLGTRTENNKDRDNKGRQVSVCGSNNGKSKLHEIDVMKIKQMLKDEWSFANIGRTFGVKWQTIQAISKGRTWKTI